MDDFKFDLTEWRKDYISSIAYHANNANIAKNSSYQFFNSRQELS